MPGGSGERSARALFPIHCFLVLTERPADVGKAFDWVETIGVEHVPTHGDPYYDVDGETLAFGRAPTRFEPYTSLDVLVIDTQHGLPPSEVTEAALRYTRLGGTTLFVGRGARGLVESLESIGSFDERFLGRAEPVPDATVVAYGLGVLATYDTDSALFQDEPSLALLDWALRQHPTPAPSRPIAARGHVEGEVAGPPPDDLEGGPKIPGLVRIPYRTLTLGLVLFTILIGPVNFLLVRRAGRPVLLTVTIPLIAAVSSLCILVFGFLSAGIDSRTSEYGYTVLDQRTHRASTVVLRSLWCGLAPAGLRPGEGSALLPTQGNELSYETVGFQVDETDGLVLGGDFVPVRRAEKQTVLADRTFRGRVTFEPKGESWSANNGLGVEIDVLVYRDRDGVLYEAKRPRRERRGGDAHASGGFRIARAGLAHAGGDAAPSRLSHVAGDDRRSSDRRRDAGDLPGALGTAVVAEGIVPGAVRRGAPCRGRPRSRHRDRVRASHDSRPDRRGGSPMSPAVLEVDRLVRDFGSFRAVDHVSFEVKQGEVCGFIGPNGAGKTTTMRICATLDLPDDGEVRVSGESVIARAREARRRLGFMPDSYGAYTVTTVRDYLDFFARSYGLDRQEREHTITRLVDFVQLGEMLDKDTTSLSKGMRQRLCLAKTLLHDPDLMILDEPASGLDPRARIELRELVKALAGMGKAILISSHILSELGEMCDSIVVIERGQVLTTGRVDELSAGIRQRADMVFVKCFGPLEPLERALLEEPGVQRVHAEGDGLAVGFRGNEEDRAELLARLVSRGLPISEFRSDSVGLEDVFLEVTEGRVQ